jgi:hypothetical protein
MLNNVKLKPKTPDMFIWTPETFSFLDIGMQVEGYP